MNEHVTKTRRTLLAARAWSDASEALCLDSMDHHYGRRVEMDGSWTVDHVFSGSPARICGHSTSGLSQLGATELMIFLNRRNEELRRGRNGPKFRGPTGSEAIHP